MRRWSCRTPAAQTTYTRLLPDGFGRAEQRALASLSPGTSMVELYLGLSDSPTRLGLHGENYWIYEGFDHDASYAASGELVDGRVTGVYASFPSARDPRATRHTAQLITWVDPAGFAAWHTQRWHQRGEEYNALKERISDALLDFVAPHLPGLRELVTFRELATPLSFEHFTGHAGGVVYGLPATPARFRLPSFGPRTSIRGLFLTGADAAALGVVGAMWGGILATAAATGTLGFPRIAIAAGKRQPRVVTEPSRSSAPLG